VGILHHHVTVFFSRLTLISSRRPLRRIVLIAPLLVACGWSSSAMAWGLGQIDIQSTLGQPFRAQVKLIGADTGNAESGCFKASIVSLDGASVSAIRAKVDAPTSTVVLTSGTAISEPAIMLQLAYQCAPQIRREYPILLDPPTSASAAAPVASSRRVPAPAEEPALAMPRNATDVASVAEPKKKRNHVAAPVVEDGQQQLAAAPTEAVAVKPKAEKKPVDKSVDKVNEKSSQKRGKNVLRIGGDDNPVSLLPNGEMRLAMSYSLNGMQGVDAPSAPATGAAEGAASIPDAGIVVVDAELQTLQEKIRQLETRTDSLRRLNAQQQAALDAAHKKEVNSDSWMVVYYVLLAGVISAIGWLIWRMRQLRSELDHSSWHEILPQYEEEDERENEPAHADMSPIHPFTADVPPQAATTPSSSGNAKPPAKPVVKADESNDIDYPFMTRLQSKMIDAEEILDEIQQAEFWMYMNQPLRAIEILESHHRETRPSSPLPWLYLFDLYRAVGDKAKYDALGLRFKAVFNCRATLWEENAGRTFAQSGRFPGDATNHRTVADR
jgi:pilus assembly protein FimV